MKKRKSQFSLVSLTKARRSGISLIELVITVVVSVIPISAIGILLVGGQRGWNRTFSSAHKQIRADAEATCAFFDRIGRKSDRHNCGIYPSGASAAVVSAAGLADAIASGQAVEFRYWQDADPGRNLRSDPEPSETPTHYARFYLVGDELKVDYGPYPYAPAARAIINTVVLAENVTDAEFNRTTLNGIGTGCVRMDLTLMDPADGESITVKAATLMRN